VKLLLDTHLLIWAAAGFEHVTAGARVLMEAPESSL
jgi:PIN domain nuclease of toxin-antitoxin system